MEAYAEAENPEQVPSDLVDKGYGSFIIPNLLEGLFIEVKRINLSIQVKFFLNLFCIAIKKFIKDWIIY